MEAVAFFFGDSYLWHSSLEHRAAFLDEPERWNDGALAFFARGCAVDSTAKPVPGRFDTDTGVAVETQRRPHPGDHAAASARQLCSSVPLPPLTPPTHP